MNHFFFHGLCRKVHSGFVLGAALALLVGVLSNGADAGGGPTFWFDSFEDGNATDGTPFTWTEDPTGAGIFSGDYSVDGGDYVFLTNNTSATADFINESMVSANTVTGFSSAATHVSLRSRMQMSNFDPDTQDGRGTVGLFLIDQANPLNGYIMLLSTGGSDGTDGDFEFFRLDNGVPTVDLGGERPFPLGGSETEVVMQLEHDGANLIASLWRPGVPQSLAEIRVGADATYTSFFGGMLLNENDFNQDFDAVEARFPWAKMAAMELIDGDLDCDGDVDFDDIDDFVLGLTDEASYEATFGLPPVMKGDTDNDGDVDFDDIDTFVQILSGPATGESHAIPEPSTATLALAGLLATAAIVLSRRVR